MEMETKVGRESSEQTEQVNAVADAIQGIAPEINPRTAEELARALISLTELSADLANGSDERNERLGSLGRGAERFRKRLLDQWGKGQSKVDFATLVPPSDRDFMDALFALSTIDLDRAGLDAEEVYISTPPRPADSGPSPLNQFYFTAPATILAAISVVLVLL